MQEQRYYFQQVNETDTPDRPLPRVAMPSTGGARMQAGTRLGVFGRPSITYQGNGELLVSKTGHKFGLIQQVNQERNLTDDDFLVPMSMERAAYSADEYVPSTSRPGPDQNQEAFKQAGDQHTALRLRRYTPDTATSQVRRTIFSRAARDTAYR